MAFDIDYLTLVGPDGNSKSGRMWRYYTEDTDTDISTAAYFDGASDLLGIGDSIQWVKITNLAADPIVAADAGTVIVLTNVAGAVDVSDEAALSVADTE